LGRSFVKKNPASTPARSMRVSGRDGWMPSSFVIDRGIVSRHARAHGEAERPQELAAQDILAGVRGDAVRRGHEVKP
jgi:hypothetical protein